MRQLGETDGTYAYTPFQDRNVSGSDILRVVEKNHYQNNFKPLTLSNCGDIYFF